MKSLQSNYLGFLVLLSHYINAFKLLWIGVIPLSDISFELQQILLFVALISIIQRENFLILMQQTIKRNVT